MNIYRLLRSGNTDYDEYVGAIVAAESEEDARMIHPDGSINETTVNTSYPDWVPPNQVIVKLIGVAANGIERGVIMDSFLAG